jgi:hypothetical protein
MKGSSAKVIYQDLVQTLGVEAGVSPAVMRYLCAAKFPAQSKEAPDEAGVARTDSIDATILKALTNNPFSSVRELSQLTCLSIPTVHRRLTESLGFTVRHLHWIPHQLSDDQKTIRLNLSREPLRVLQRQQTREWHDTLTLDELWFYFPIEHGRIWRAPEKPVPDKEQRKYSKESIIGGRDRELAAPDN